MEQPETSGPGALPPLGTSTRNDPTLRRAAFIYGAIAAGAIPLAVYSFGLNGSTLLSNLPTASVDLSFSFTRMLLAYLLSLGFALAYGYYASTHRAGERVMIPVLDILQSVPILGFFPLAIVFFVALTPGSPIGENIASIFLIFTCMAWNMVFGVYESLKTLPNELREAANSFGSHGFQRLRRVVLPATVNRLVYNSVLSWTAGWFFLVEAEIFTTSGTSPLPGIGSYLSIAASRGGAGAFLAGLIPLIILIVILDIGVWRPLGRWAERFRYDQASAGESIAERATEGPRRFRRAAAYVTRGVRTGVARVGSPFVQLAAFTSRATRVRVRKPVFRAAVHYVALGTILVIVWLMLIALGVAIYDVFSGTIVPNVRNQIILLPVAMGASTLRVVTAYLVCLAIALPLAAYLARSPRAARGGLPMVEIIASFPATALFPVIIFQLVPYITPEGAAIIMLMTGMIWYLFFNLLAGIRSVPPDLEEAARSFGLDRRKLFRRVILPGTFTALVTGSITAFGGGWNTLIVAEYLQGGPGQLFQVFGIGQQIDLGYAEPNGLPLMVAALLVLVATVIAINELIWKPLYRKSIDKYRYD
ncbi:MAG: ABC transporter permease subunit [Thermoplasmata archaeon]